MDSSHFNDGLSSMRGLVQRDGRRCSHKSECMGKSRVSLAPPSPPLSSPSSSRLHTVGTVALRLATTTMSNQLAIPLKRASPIPIRQAIQSYIRENIVDVHPEAFKYDIEQWEELRRDVTNDTIHVSRTQAAIKCVCFQHLVSCAYAF